MHAVTPTASRGIPAAPGAPQTRSEQLQPSHTDTMRQALEKRAVLVDLALWIADSAARSDIECECRIVSSGGADWLDLDTAGADANGVDEPAYTQSIVARADRYFRLRDDQADQFRVIRNPAFPRLVRFEAIERTCRACGCTDSQACEAGCWWIEADLCSQCSEKVDD
jgi:hypothetical protein